MPVIEGIDVEQRGSGRALVILHSLLADRSAFDRVAPILARKHRVWLVNLPGYGAAGTSVEDYADRVAALIDKLKLSAQSDVLGNGSAASSRARSTSRSVACFPSHSSRRIPRSWRSASAR
jgi:pimeloyl-ACP methyl ester carboxylesterase